MSAGQQMPPWLQEQIGKLQQSQQSLQSIMAQKQQVEMDSAEADKALEVFKHAGSILIKSTKNVLIEELEEKKELAKTQITVLTKQEERIKVSLQEQEKKIQEMLKNPTSPDSNTPQK